MTRDPFRCRSGRIPLREPPLPRFGRLARASAPLLIFAGGSRELPSAVGGRPVYVVNAIYDLRAAIGKPNRADRDLTIKASQCGGPGGGFKSFAT
jgi:hypothetical protein